MSEAVSKFSISLEQVEDYEFRVRFDKPSLPDLTLDEPPPLGRERGPSPARILAASVAACLSSSLLFCANKARVRLTKIHTEVSLEIVRNENKRLRIGRMEVVIDPHIPDSEKDNAQRCLGLFEDFCVVTQSVREGIGIDVRVVGFSRAD